MFQDTFELLAKQISNDPIKTIPVHLKVYHWEISINSNEMQPIPD